MFMVNRRSLIVWTMTTTTFPSRRWFFTFRKWLDDNKGRIFIRSLAICDALLIFIESFILPARASTISIHKWISQNLNNFSRSARLQIYVDGMKKEETIYIIAVLKRFVRPADNTFSGGNVIEWNAIPSRLLSCKRLEIDTFRCFSLVLK